MGRLVVWLLVGVLASGLVFATPAAARPTVEHAPAAAKAADAHGGHDAATDGTWKWVDLGLWTVVVFLVLMLVLRRFAWGPMLAGLQQRENNIRSALEEAERARGEAQAIRAALQKDMDQAHLKVKEIIDEAKRDAERVHADTVAKAKADIAVERERLHREIQSETDQALQALWTRAADLATQVSAKAIGRQLDGDAQRRLIDEALAEIRTSGINAHA